MTKIPFMDLKEENAFMLPEIEAAVAGVVRSGLYLRGPATARFEKQLADLCGASHAVGVSNGLDALRLIFRAYIENGRLKPGDEIIYPANTYIASILPLSEFGLIPRGVEPSELDFNLDLRDALRNLSPLTKGVLLVHLYGNPSWNSEAAEELHRRGILIIEDNAQAIGAVASSPGLTGVSTTGGLADAAAFSFYPTKNIGALGDAGAVVTSDSRLADTVRALANYGSDRRYHNIYRGYNCRIDEIQAAALSVKLSHLGEITRRRRETAMTYDHLIDNPVVTKPRIFSDRTQVFHQYVIRTPHRDSLRRFLDERGIATDIHYAVPPHLQPCYESSPLPSFPITERLASEIISLPVAGMSRESIRAVAENINNFPQHQSS